MTPNTKAWHQAAARLIASLYDEPDRPVERVLVRSIHDQLYAVQVWYRDENDPESFFTEIPDSILNQKVQAAVRSRETGEGR